MKLRHLGKDRVLNNKFDAFSRNDTEKWTLWRILIANVLGLYWVKIALCWLIVFTYLPTLFLLMIGANLDKPQEKWRTKFIHYSMITSSRVFLYICGFWHIGVDK
jgi:hypothetical protein